MTFGNLVDSLGGWKWPPAVKGAKLVAGKCAKLGGKWLYRESFSEMTFYLKLKHVHREVLTQKWAQLQAWKSDVDDAGALNPPRAAAAEDQILGATEAEMKAAQKVLRDNGPPAQTNWLAFVESPVPAATGIQTGGMKALLQAAEQAPPDIDICRSESCSSPDMRCIFFDYPEC